MAEIIVIALKKHTPVRVVSRPGLGPGSDRSLRNVSGQIQSLQINGHLFQSQVSSNNLISLTRPSIVSKIMTLRYWV